MRVYKNRMIRFMYKDIHPAQVNKTFAISELHQLELRNLDLIEDALIRLLVAPIVYLFERDEVCAALLCKRTTSVHSSGLNFGDTGYYLYTECVPSREAG